MTLIVEDRVYETTTSTGTGDIALAGAVAGFRRFGDVMSIGDVCAYAIEAVDSHGLPTGAWETGLGTYSAANTLTRTTVSRSSNSNAAVSFAAGDKRVAITPIGTMSAPVALISSITAAGGETSVDFTNIPAIYRHLRLTIMGRCNAVASNENLKIRLNGDTTAANYTTQQIQGQNSGVSANSFVGSANYSATIGALTAASSAANVAGYIESFFPFYSGTTFYKCFQGITSDMDFPMTKVMGGMWKSTAAINRITVSFEEGMPAFVAGSSFCLYGMS